MIADKLILTKEQSDAWISRLELSPIDSQIEMIRDRILLDTNVYVKSYYSDRIRLQGDSEHGKKVEAYGRPIIIVNGKCRHYRLNITNSTRNETVRQLAELLTGKNVKLVEVHKGDKAMAIYGARADSGVIILTTKSRRACKNFERIQLNQILS